MSSDRMLAVDQVHKRFGGFRALDGVSLSVGEGQVLGLVGPNGSGKTTLINVVSGIYALDGGQVRLGERAISGLVPHRIARLGLNRTFQIPKPFLSLTVRQNVEIALHHTRRATRDAREILSFVGLEAESEREAASLNTAQQKLLDLARALATEPRLLLVDELGAGLGPADLEHVAQKLRALADSGVALLVVEHLMGFLGSLTDEVVVMNAGVEIFAGRLSEAVRDQKVVEVFLGG